MTYEIVVVFIVLVSAILLFLTERLRSDVIGLLILVALGCTKVLSPKDLLAGFGNQAVITIAAMFILSAALMRTGVVSSLGNKMAHLSAGNPWRFLLLSMLVVCVLSAFINNTPVVLVFIPAVVTVCRQIGASPSKFLMPISFASMLGGSCTLVGTSTNILVSSLAEETSVGALNLFEFAWVGVPMAIAGLIYLVSFSQRYLPKRITLAVTASETVKSYVTEIEIGGGSPMIGKTLGDSLLADAGLRVVELIRGDVVRPLDKATPLECGDILLVRGELKNVLALDLQHAIDVVLTTADGSPKRAQMTLAEVLIAPNSPIIGRTCREVGLHSRYGVTAFALLRGGKHQRQKIADTQLQLGDVLVVRGKLSAVERLRDSEAFILLEGVHEEVVWRRRAPIAIGVIASVIGLAAFKVLPISILALLGVAVVLMTRVVTPRHAYRSIDWSILVLIAGMISLGHAMQDSGAVDLMARKAIEYAGGIGPHPALFVFYAITMLVTATISTKASAVLLTPLAFSVAQTLGVSPKPFVMAVAYASSTGFATPIGFQTNLMVLGPGGYYYKDFLKFGIPLCFLIWIVACSIIPRVWPF
jgi:di/tricarboxylate transporter